jgi:hypothetical protein
MYRYSDVLTDPEVKELKRLVREAPEESLEIQELYGRLCINRLKVPMSVIYKMKTIAEQLSGTEMDSDLTPLCVVYSPKYGIPDLPPHFDRDETDYVFSYQLESNVTWDIGVDLDTYSLKDNELVAFNPNLYIHWRAHKEFKDGEFVKMIFFRFQDKKGPTDYGHPNYDTYDPIFKMVRDLRDKTATR